MNRFSHIYPISFSDWISTVTIFPEDESRLTAKILWIHLITQNSISTWVNLNREFRRFFHVHLCILPVWFHLDVCFLVLMKTDRLYDAVAFIIACPRLVLSHTFCDMTSSYLAKQGTGDWQKHEDIWTATWMKQRLHTCSHFISIFMPKAAPFSISTEWENLQVTFWKMEWITKWSKNIKNNEF